MVTWISTTFIFKPLKHVNKHFGFISFVKKKFLANNASKPKNSLSVKQQYETIKIKFKNE